MRLLVTLVFLIAVVAVPLSVFAEPAKTIDELAAMYNVDACADCHEDIHKDWKDSWHSKSLTDSRVIRTWRTFILNGLDKDGMPRAALKDTCLGCHAPQIKDAAPEVSVKIAELILIAADDPDASKKEAAVNELSKLNVNCIICHNLKATPGGNPQAKTIYGPKGNVDAGPHKEQLGFETAKSDYLRQAKFCSECHHGCSPGMTAERCPTLWFAYNEHYLTHGGNKTCQNCHMDAKDYGMSHKFPGIMEVDFAKTGIDLTLNASATEYLYHLDNKIVPAVIVNVQVKNTAGHGIPHG
ncbi:MAG: hypothetical protein HZB61_13610 [Nitrospirae bacterium]|nr:hypothetical protein [Nitrospirota bacterium]